jgi:hypothetical protein
MSRLCCRERIPPPSEAVSIHLLNRKKKHTNQQHSPRCLGRRPGTHQQCGRDSRQAVTGRIQDAVLQVQQHVEQADAECGMFSG